MRVAVCRKCTAVRERFKHSNSMVAGPPVHGANSPSPRLQWAFSLNCGCFCGLARERSHCEAPIPSTADSPCPNAPHRDILPGQRQIRPRPKSTLFAIVKKKPKIPSYLAARTQRLRSMRYTSEGADQFAWTGGFQVSAPVQKARPVLEIAICMGNSKRSLGCFLYKLWL